MANKMHKSFSFFLMYALVVTLQLIQVQGGYTPCTVILTSCHNENCNQRCMEYRGDARLLRSNCNFHNLCTCEFDRPPVGRSCTAPNGLCSYKCNESCCNAKCKDRYRNTGTGICVVDYNLYFCKCVYQR
ncbi:unnamed protein product [Vicia faba]|uniref:Defensin-like protein n=1 Tax=Vicia faba TaxID=3906 RepID=A0AAV0YUR5_VICFA|nr:unnamed protein product [Vicia faba]